VTERTTDQGSKSFWTKVGSAFENKDGSVTVKLEALPLSGTLQIRDAETPEEREARKSARSNNAPF
jgi:hypothetical protein